MTTRGSVHWTGTCLLALTTVSPLQLSPSDRAVMLPTARVPMEHPRSPPFDSHVLARRSSATTVATAATGDASTMTALRTGGPRRSASLPTPPRRPTRTCMPPSRARADAAGAAVKSEVRGLDGVRGQPATGGGAVVCRRQWRTGGASERQKLEKAGETVVRRESVALSQ